MYDSIESGDALLNNRRKKTPLFLDIVLLVVVLFFSGLVFFYYFLAFSPISGNSMLNTIEWGQCVLLQRHMYTLERGDIVTLDIAEDSEEPHILIKRVIGLEGDKLMFVRSKNNIFVDLYVCKNGETKFELMNEPYIYERMKWNPDPDSTLYEKVTVAKYIDSQSILDIDITATYDDVTQKNLQKQLITNSFTVPDGEIFFLGDNRNNSNDSRHYGTQSKSRIIGKVIKIIDEGSTAEHFFRFMFNNYKTT